MIRSFYKYVYNHFSAIYTISERDHRQIKKILGERVKDVKVSNRLSDSPSCIVVDENDPTAQMQEMMRSMGQGELPDVKPILEINPNHKIIKKLKDKTRQKSFNDIVEYAREYYEDTENRKKLHDIETKCIGEMIKIDEERGTRLCLD